jgi:hypothetical protein
MTHAHGEIVEAELLVWLATRLYAAYAIALQRRVALSGCLFEPPSSSVEGLPLLKSWLEIHWYRIS